MIAPGWGIARQGGARWTQKHYQATSPRIFGPVARNEAGAESDLDLLVEMEPGRRPGCRVDGMAKKVLRERYKERILEDAVPLRGAISDPAISMKLLDQDIPAPLSALAGTGSQNHETAQRYSFRSTIFGRSSFSTDAVSTTVSSIMMGALQRRAMAIPSLGRQSMVSVCEPWLRRSFA